MKNDLEERLNALDVFGDNMLNCFASCGHSQAARADGEVYNEKKSVRLGYDCQFTVFRGNESRGYGFNFFFKPEADRVKVWGEQSFSFNEGCLDDDDSGFYSAEMAGKALEIAVDYLTEKYHRKIDVEPKEYYIGRYLAWNIK